MSDTYTLKLKNFRSLHDVSVDIAPLTVVYGPNGAGKSSLIYGLLTLKNFLTNPSRNLPSLFSYPTMSLGGHDEVVTGHDAGKLISLSLSASTPRGGAYFNLRIGQSGGQSTIEVESPRIPEDGHRMSLDIPFPYHGDQSVAHHTVMAHSDEALFEGDMSNIQLTWNGIIAGEAGGDPANREQVADLLTSFNLPMELLRGTSFVPLRRGFSKPIYGVSNVTPNLATEDEVASLLANDRYLEYGVSGYVESIAQRRVAFRSQIGTATFTVDSVPLDGGTPVSMVNDGFGVNQLAYMLTLCLNPGARMVAIEEPEIHLHPSIIRRLVQAMADIALEHGKRFIVSTHSEVFVVALLAQIAAGKIDVEDVSFILAEKEGNESRFTKQEAKSNGQVQGGLDSFVASGFEDIALFLGIDSEAAIRS